MAFEVAIRIKSRHRSTWKQAIFIEESDLDGTLAEAREVIVRQEVQVPEDYRFLSSSGNVIPKSAEESILLRYIFAAKSSGLKGDDIDNHKSVKDETEIILNESQILEKIKSDDPNKSENESRPRYSSKSNDNENDKDDIVPELWLTSFKDFSASVNDSTNDSDHGNMASESHLQPPTSTCPWKKFVGFISDNDGIQLNNLFKILFFLITLLFMMLVALVLSTHLIFGSLSSLSSRPEFSSILGQLRSRDGNDEGLNKLQLKLSEMELSWQYKVDALSTKLAELEDLYLNDLTVQKREMAALKRENGQTTGHFASQEDLEILVQRMERLAEYVGATDGEGVLEPYSMEVPEGN